MQTHARTHTQSLSPHFHLLPAVPHFSQLYGPLSLPTHPPLTHFRTRLVQLIYTLCVHSHLTLCEGGGRGEREKEAKEEKRQEKEGRREEGERKRKKGEEWRME